MLLDGRRPAFSVEETHYHTLTKHLKYPAALKILKAHQVTAQIKNTLNQKLNFPQIVSLESFL